MPPILSSLQGTKTLAPSPWTAERAGLWESPLRARRETEHRKSTSKARKRLARNLPERCGEASAQRNTPKAQRLIAQKGQQGGGPDLWAGWPLLPKLAEVEEGRGSLKVSLQIERETEPNSGLLTPGLGPAIHYPWGKCFQI